MFKNVKKCGRAQEMQTVSFLKLECYNIYFIIKVINYKVICIELKFFWLPSLSWGRKILAKAWSRPCLNLWRAVNSRVEELAGEGRELLEKILV